MPLIRERIGFEPINAPGQPSKQLVNSDVLLGIEVELEGVEDVPEVSGAWRVVRDNSLRGYGGREYIFRRPYNGLDVPRALAQLEKAFTGVTPVVGPDTSVHVHVNCLELTTKQYYNFVSLAIVFEPIIMNTICSGRENNPFCQQAADVATIPQQMATHIARCLYAGPGRMSRYAGINVECLNKFGSVEFRGHPATYKKADLLAWCNVLLCMYNYILTIDIPVQQYLKALDYDQALREVFGDRLSGYPGCNYEMLYKIGMRTSRQFRSYLDHALEHYKRVAKVKKPKRKPATVTPGRTRYVRGLGVERRQVVQPTRGRTTDGPREEHFQRAMRDLLQGHEREDAPAPAQELVELDPGQIFFDTPYDNRGD